MKRGAASDTNSVNTTRDEFTKPTKTALALRAGHRCSYCGKATSGPSDTETEKHISVGEAAHIAAAAPGGARYDAEMTPQQRSSINNGIWMCKLYARLIDVDAFAYPVAVLHTMKAEHEKNIRLEMIGERQGPKVFDFIAIGPSVVFVGDLVAIEQKSWTFRVEHFVIGELQELISYIEQFEAADPYDRFVLVNELGDGRELFSAPSWSRSGESCLITAPIKESCKKIDVHALPMDLALGDDHDLVFENGGFARVRGLDALPQKVKTCLSMRQGESVFAPTFGTRIREYTVSFMGSPWLPRLIKLEVIRMASIPFSDSLGITPPVPPLRCVRRVKAVEQIGTDGDKGWFAFRFRLVIEGLGEWEREIPVFIGCDLG